jgi:hypothetical protein
MTRRERLERKVEKRLEWADSRKAKAEAAHRTSDRLVEHIPFGQPILVGHHSERGHRRTLERSQNLMFKMVEHNAMADHHKSTAAGLICALDKSIFSDDADAIEAIEERIKKREAQRERNNAINKIIRKKPKNEATPEKIKALEALGMSEGIAIKLFEPDFCGRIGIPAYVNQNLGGNISTDRKRLEQLKRAAEIRAKAEETESGILIEKSNGYAYITFTEKPEYDIRAALKAAGFRWNKASWVGPADSVPDCIEA